jgi:hypothetical protein
MPEAFIQPQGYALLNPQSRLARNAHTVMLGSADIDIVTGKLLTGAGTFSTNTPALNQLARINKPVGQAMALRKGTWRAALPRPVGTQSFVEFWYGYPTSDNGNKGNGTVDPTFATGCTNNMSAICTRLGQYSVNNDSWGALYEWNATFISANETIPANVLTMLVVARYQNRTELWRDGALKATRMGGPMNLNSCGLVTGAFLESDYWSSSSDMVMAGRSLVELSPDEIRAFCLNPWSIFYDEEEAEIVFGPTYTLPFDAGIFSAAGQAVSLKAARRLAAAAGGFTLTTLAASLLAVRRIVAAPGALSLTGAGANLKAARRLPAAVGAVALTGAAAKLTAARKLTVAPAAFALTGGTATFVYTSAPGGQGPTYTLTGGSGAFLLTASTARLLLARRLVAAAGAFSAAGSPVTLVATRRLAAAAGSLAIVAAPAGLRATRRLPAAAASFSLTGSTATFFYSPIDRPGTPTYTLTAIGGALGLTGTGIGMRARRRLSGGAGQLSLTGSSAQLVYSQQIVYARAPAGSGYTPKTVAAQHRPASAPSVRPAALQRNTR